MDSLAITLSCTTNMGCGGSKEDPVKPDNEEGENQAQEQASRHSNSQPDAPARLDGEEVDANKSDAPHSVRRAIEAVDGEKVVLPKGDWVKAKDTPYYYSQTENLYYHPPSCQFYDPTNEMWYDSEKNEWYRDDDDLVVEE